MVGWYRTSLEDSPVLAKTGASVDDGDFVVLVLSSSPPGFVGLLLLADKARYERESSLLPRE